METVNYSGAEDRDAKYTEYVGRGYLLKEERNHFDGNALVFYTPAEAEEYLGRIETDRALAKLKEIDLASIRSLREYITAKGDAPQYLQEHEQQAISVRAKG